MPVKQVVTTNFAFEILAETPEHFPPGSIEDFFYKNFSKLDTLLATFATIADVQQGSIIYAADTGTANVYAVAITPAPTLAAGLQLFFKAAHANTGASTLAINGGTAKAITKSGTSALVGAEISAGQIVLVVYDGTQFQMISI
jgi:hypothetical protein